MIYDRQHHKCGEYTKAMCLSAVCLNLVLFQILMNSKLPVDLLMKIWDLGDIDKDGYLDRDEFSVVRCNLSVILLLPCHYPKICGKLHM